MTIGERIRTKREEYNISQTELASRVGITKQSLYKYEKGIITNIPSDTIERLSEALYCSPAYIMGWSDGSGESDKVKKALELYEDFQNAIPQVQEAVERLLKPSQSES